MESSSQAKKRYWQGIVARSKSRTGSLEAFADAEGISLHTLQYWRQKFAVSALAPSPAPPSKKKSNSNFVKVEITKPAEAAGPSVGKAVALPDPMWLASFILNLQQLSCSR